MTGQFATNAMLTRNRRRRNREPWHLTGTLAPPQRHASTLPSAGLSREVESICPADAGDELKAVEAGHLERGHHGVFDPLVAAFPEGSEGGGALPGDAGLYSPPIP
jgi:hypothetical protein